MDFKSELEKTVKKNALKVEKAKDNMLLHMKKQIGESNKGLSDLINDKLNDINEQIAKIDGKYSSLFGALVGEFLVKLEKRTYENEIYMSAMYRLNIEEMYKMQNSIDLGMTQDEYAKSISERLASLIEEEVEKFSGERKKEEQPNKGTTGTSDGESEEVNR